MRLDSPSMATFEEQLVEHRVYLLRFARLQLRNDAWAEDAVSETLLAALSKPQSFGNRSQLKTWLVGILKHKVIDLIRSHAREVALPDHGADDEADGLELSCEEVCKELSLTPTNLYVQLHRARLRLRECLAIHWFGPQAH